MGFRLFFTAAHLGDCLELGEQHVASPAPAPVCRVPAPVPAGGTEIVRSTVPNLAACVIGDSGGQKSWKPLEFVHLAFHQVCDMTGLSWVGGTKHHGSFYAGDVGTKPFEVFGAGDVEPNRLDQLHIARDQEHVGIGVAIFTVAPYVILAAAIRLQRARGTPKLARVFAGQAEIEFNHPAHHREIEGTARRNPPLHLELMVDVGIRALVLVRQCTDNIPLGDGVLGGGCALNDARQHGAPVEARERIREGIGARESETKFIAMDIGIRPRSVSCQERQGGIGGDSGLAMFKVDRKGAVRGNHPGRVAGVGQLGQNPATAVALERNVRCIAW
ncbi:hypothetical protein PG984_013257 [Apiospora sp. TS-2023a]